MDLPEEYFSLIESMVPRTKKDGKLNGTDVTTLHDAGGDYELIGVAVDLRRPLMKDRMEKTISYTKRMQKQYDMCSAKSSTDNNAKKDKLYQDHTNVISFHQPSKPA